MLLSAEIKFRHIHQHWYEYEYIYTIRNDLYMNIRESSRNHQHSIDFIFIFTLLNLHFWLNDLRNCNT